MRAARFLKFSRFGFRSLSGPSHLGAPLAPKYQELTGAKPGDPAPPCWV